MRLTRIVGLFVGGVVALIGIMALVGLLTDNFWARLLVGLLVVLVVPAVVSDRILRRTSLGGLSFVADVFAIVLLAIALTIVSLGAMAKPLLVREGDRHARAGSRTMARVVYFVAGVSPTFPDAKPDAVKAAASASSASPDAGAVGR